jgi:lipopolysaccharide export system protein LptA
MTASGGSGTGAVSFAATGAACQIPTSGTDAGKLVITSGTGTCSITATKAGDYNYQSATSAPQQVAINKAELKINADNQSVVYGAANPTLTYKFSGFVNGDTSAAGLTGDAACSVAEGTDRNVGTYTGAITCAPGTLSSTNYRFATGTKGDVTITKRPITVTADAKSKTYGENDPALTYQVTSTNKLVQGDSFTGGLSRVTGEGVGQYDINQGTLSRVATTTSPTTGPSSPSKSGR